MSIWTEPLTKTEYLRRLFEAKLEQRKRDADLPFTEKVGIVLALQEASRLIRGAVRAANAGPDVGTTSVLDTQDDGRS